MSQDSDKWSKTVFRVRGLPSDVKTLEDVASLLSSRLGDIPSDRMKVYSLANTLDFTNYWDAPSSKMATMMFQSLPSLVQSSPLKKEWSISAKGSQSVDELILDIHFMGMTPLNEVESDHLFEYTALILRPF
jgi:hypothetical protein